RAEQAAEGSGEQQRSRARLKALAGDVDQTELQTAVALVELSFGIQAFHVAAGRDEEVTGERLAAGGLEGELQVPALGKERHPALRLQPFAQVEKHRLAARAAHAEPHPLT